MPNWNSESPPSAAWSKTCPSSTETSVASKGPNMSSPGRGLKTSLEFDPAKPMSSHCEMGQTSISANASDPDPFDEPATKMLLRKLDRHLIPYLAITYLFCYVDRTNIGNARLANLEKNLHMKGLDYNIALSVFFPCFLISVIPSNMMLKRFRPSIWFTIIITSWGLVMTFMSFVKTYHALVVCRCLLGVAEGGLSPGFNYYLTMWYRRHECGFRTALYFSAPTAAGALGGLFARALSTMDGVAGKPGWAWIFLLEGVLTLIIGLFSFWAIHDSPKTAKFLEAVERVEVKRRLDQDSKGLCQDFHFKYMTAALKDWKIWVNCFIAVGVLTPLYSISLFMPSIINIMGYSTNASQLLTVPPYAVACVFTLAGSWLSDKAGRRGIFLLGFLSTAIVGFAILLSTRNPAVQYLGTFVVAIGIYSSVPLIVVWNSNNIGGSLKRGVGIAMVFGIGTLGGTISGFTYISTDAPRFKKGHAILAGLSSMSLILSALMTTYFKYENMRRDKAFGAQNLPIEEYTEAMKFEEREKGEYATFYRYTL